MYSYENWVTIGNIIVIVKRVTFLDHSVVKLLIVLYGFSRFLLSFSFASVMPNTTGASKVIVLCMKSVLIEQYQAWRKEFSVDRANLIKTIGIAKIPNWG